MTTETILWAVIALIEFTYFVAFFASFIVTLLIYGVYNLILVPRLGLSPLNLVEIGLMVMLFDFASNHWVLAFNRGGSISTLDMMKRIEAERRKA